MSLSPNTKHENFLCEIANSLFVAGLALLLKLMDRRQRDNLSSRGWKNLISVLKKIFRVS